MLRTLLKLDEPAPRVTRVRTGPRQPALARLGVVRRRERLLADVARHGRVMPLGGVGE